MAVNMDASANVLPPEPDKRYVRDKMVWNPAMHAIPISGIRRMVNRAAELDDVVHLSIGQPDFGTPKHIIDAHIHALQAGQTGYTMDAGLPELLTAPLSALLAIAACTSVGKRSSVHARRRDTNSQQRRHRRLLRGGRRTRARMP